ncbi:hypothetical protein G7Z17_g1778 [Cylindrodendrum hubeiense]|uniref:Alginate lyase domain-containing protein n=1 Tax=Cylindrodendrum hubeiense TaxID=595255 RepID=A0A9P5HE46_9HYPO|nr:hypothetical protein G7Z17_g1778 [Cylindrodendrum hubeiense]
MSSSIFVLLILAVSASALSTRTTTTSSISRDISALDSRQSGFNHPGLLHTNRDFIRVRAYVESGIPPWSIGWVKLLNHIDISYVPTPHPTIWRGTNTEHAQNYPDLYFDIAAAYTLAIGWKITGDSAYAAAAASILDAWSSTLVEIRGPSDRFLASGLYGYQLANVAEILRDYDDWDGFDAMAGLLLDVFYPMNSEFIAYHLYQPDDHYWANWDLANIAAMMAIGVLVDDRDIWDEAVDYFKRGNGMGAIENAIWTLHYDNTSKILGQGQEAGRDQGHSILDFALLGVVAQQGYNQHEDLWAYLDNRILAGAEYMAKYNTGHDVPFTTYVNSVHGTYTEISSTGRGGIRPIGELIYSHYASIKGLDASFIGAYRDMVVEAGGGAEGGVGDYGRTSGGYDQLGFGTLLFRLEA